MNGLNLFVIGFVIFLVIFYFVYKYVMKIYKRYQCSFLDHVVLVTGAGSGLGKALCHEFAKEKCNVICVDIDEKNNEITVEELKQILEGTDCKVVGYKCDISDREQIVQLAQKVLSEFGQLDILINNAGIANMGDILDFPPSLLKKTFDINVMSHFWAIQEFLPQMLKRNKGYIIGTASIVSFAGFPELAPYCTSKFAVLGLMESLKAELLVKGSNVKTLSIHPAFMATNMLHKVFSETTRARWFYIKKPDYFARGIVNALKEGRTVVVLPGYFAPLLFMYQFISPFVKKNVCYKLLPASSMINKNFRIPKQKPNID